MGTQGLSALVQAKASTAGAHLKVSPYRDSCFLRGDHPFPGTWVK